MAGVMRAAKIKPATSLLLLVFYLKLALARASCDDNKIVVVVARRQTNGIFTSAFLPAGRNGSIVGEPIINAKHRHRKCLRLSASRHSAGDEVMTIIAPPR